MQKIYSLHEWEAKGYAAQEEAELDYYRRLPDIDTAIARASHARVPNKRGTGVITHSHFRNKQESLFVPAWRKLRTRKGSIAKSTDFHRLYTLVELELTGGADAVLKGKPDMLYVYDVSLWIGAHLGLLPSKIYLHAGTRRGAQELLGRDLTGRSSLNTEELPSAWGIYPAYQIESILCGWHGGLWGEAGR